MFDGKTTLNAEPGISGVTVYPTSTRLSTNAGASGSVPTAENVNAGPKVSQRAMWVFGSTPLVLLQTRTEVFDVVDPWTAFTMFS